MTLEKEWWRKSVVYQIYPQSFQDSNGDGVGDLNGIRRRLPYLAQLGIDLIWICPIFLSPMVDNGYDVADYGRVDPRYGTNEDLSALIEEAASYGIRLVLDLVINHCSDQHAWFKKAVDDPESREAGYFYFRRTQDGNIPNNWRSNFGGPAWTQLPDGRWYYHTFAPQQPDLNWENPQLRSALYDMVNGWLEQGIAGFRIDAITFIKKDLTFASRPMPEGELYRVENFQNYPGIGEFLNELKRECFDKHNCVTIAEAPGVGPDGIAEYCGADGYFSMIFDFGWSRMRGESAKSSMEAIEAWKKRMMSSQLSICRSGWSGVFLENHDQARCANKFLDPEDISETSMAALGALYMFMHGTPFIYQGQEIGMTNATWTSIDQFQDVAAHSRYREAIEKGVPEKTILQDLCAYGRDNARTPFQWDATPQAGFTTGTPWLRVNERYTEVNAQEQLARENSLFHRYRQLVALRRSPEYADVFAYGTFRPIMMDCEGVIGYERAYGDTAVFVLVNLSHEEKRLACRAEKILFTNMEGSGAAQEHVILAPYQAVVGVSGGQFRP